MHYCRLFLKKLKTLNKDFRKSLKTLFKDFSYLRSFGGFGFLFLHDVYRRSKGTLGPLSGRLDSEVLP